VLPWCTVILDAFFEAGREFASWPNRGARGLGSFAQAKRGERIALRMLNIAGRWLCAILAIAAVFALAACGSDDDSGDEQAAGDSSTSEQSDSGGVDTLKLALYPSTDYAALMYGVEEGIFEKHGVKLEIEQVLTGSALTSAITSGDFDLATNSPTSMTTGISNGLPVKMVAVANQIPTDGYVETLVKNDSGIDSFADLEGKTAATVNLQGSFDLGTRSAVAAAGGDAAKLKTLAMAPTDEPQALAAGRLEAITLQDPFLATAKKNKDFKSLGNPFSELDYPIYGSGIWSSNDTIEEKGAAFAKFRDALGEASEAVKADGNLGYEVIPTYTELSLDEAKALTLPVYTTEISEEELQPMIDQMSEYGWIKGDPPTYDDIVWAGP
jgi:NitT/TauT family transport system substrate-binding protein